MIEKNKYFNPYEGLNLHTRKIFANEDQFYRIHNVLSDFFNSYYQRSEILHYHRHKDENGVYLYLYNSLEEHISTYYLSLSVSYDHHWTEELFSFLLDDQIYILLKSNASRNIFVDVNSSIGGESNEL